ncbi:MAG: flagellar biosynthesis protein FlgN [Treponema sp.]|jgi:prefoldin subunit 5|nr:flagellar biosynthesis protein FlgN [Treponema sp.]
MAQTPNTGLDREELNQRIAILRRFRTLLVEQRDRFRAYLEELDQQKDVIETGSAEELIAHVAMEEKIVADIFAIQKVIVPLDTMYHSAPDSSGAEAEVQGLKSALDNLKKEAVIRSNRNKDILSRRMMEIREEIKSLRANPRRPGGNYAPLTRPGGPSLVDITG